MKAKKAYLSRPGRLSAALASRDEFTKLKTLLRRIETVGVGGENGIANLDDLRRLVERLRPDFRRDLSGTDDCTGCERCWSCQNCFTCENCQHCNTCETCFSCQRQAAAALTPLGVDAGDREMLFSIAEMLNLVR